MMDIFQALRREPRVRLNTRAYIRLYGEHDRSRHAAITLDVSPHGASIMTDVELTMNAIVVYEAAGYRFRARARVRSRNESQDAASPVFGIEFLDDATNPLVIWGAAHPAPATPARDRPPPADEQAPRQSAPDRRKRRARSGR